MAAKFLNSVRVLLKEGCEDKFIAAAEEWVSTEGMLDSYRAKIGDRLVDLHGQHDHQALLHPEIHVELLDLYGKCNSFRDEFSKVFSDYQTQSKTLNSMKRNGKR